MRIYTYIIGKFFIKNFPLLYKSARGKHLFYYALVYKSCTIVIICQLWLHLKDVIHIKVRPKRTDQHPAFKFLKITVEEIVKQAVVKITHFQSFFATCTSIQLSLALPYDVQETRRISCFSTERIDFLNHLRYVTLQISNLYPST